LSGQLGRYQIVRLLGRGGMADVYVARRRGAGGVEKRLVVKTIRSERARDPRMIALFVREARVSMALSHQNVVPVFDFGRAGDALFLAMELVDGGDLGAVLSHGPLDPLLVAFVGAECCAALAYAHGQGVVHRDVTPRNILVSRAGEVRLTDFGVAGLRAESDGSVRGTPQYMAPEQARADEIDGRADLYALGLVLREAAGGAATRPDDPLAALAAARDGAAVPALELPGGLGEVIARATATRPDDRYPDARAMRDALDRVVAALRGDRGAPSHLLADVLRDRLGAARAGTDEPDGSSLTGVTFLDDGEAAVLGSATARSLAATVPGEVPAAAPPAPPARRRRSALALVAAAAVVAVIGAAWLATRPGARVVAATAPLIDAGVADAAIEVDAAADIADAAIAIDAAVAVDAAIADDAGPRRPPRSRSPRAPAPTATAPADRKVTINALPWATFYVDDDPTPRETPETVELAPGSHRVRFVNPRLRVDRTITLDVPVGEDVKHVEKLVSDGP